MLKEFLSRFFERGRDLPAEYDPWMKDLKPLIGYCRNAIDDELLNSDGAEYARVLSKFFFLGVFDYYAKIHNLTYGQYRELFLRLGPLLGFDISSCSIVFDCRNDISPFYPELENERERVMKKGFEVGRRFFRDREWTGRYEYGNLIGQWKLLGYIRTHT